MTQRNLSSGTTFERSQALREARARIRAVSFSDMLLASNKDLIERAAQFLVSNPQLGDGKGAFEAAVIERVDLLGIQSCLQSFERPSQRLYCQDPTIRSRSNSEEAITSTSSAEDAEVLKRTMKWKEFSFILTNTFGTKRESDE
ncbi:hypothetical protein PPL_02673 [Heterostelium album PN500]|uniref:Uncharacterized protein n=1 Tax=Heterostelium pallidum (strain ATCC 26659 / Pp 5 / PN500) TaxID=670386 RepID=D3B2Q9_HETP5|nr:hypothetical protein PPL_02673 [Heterostelium album PN500]EFA83607.1 hypothetical protein PPL_02673 [Heterostelium album PN500]|eukprot:XP_020435724.1 hypothetical protein PPL_02673 [Heterostelium album PN500]